MTNINIKITKDMTEEERKNAKREYMREWLRKKREEDPEYQARQNQKNKEYNAHRRKTDPAFLERDRKYQYDKYHKYKDVYKQIRDLGKEAYAKVQQEMV